MFLRPVLGVLALALLGCAGSSRTDDSTTADSLATDTTAVAAVEQPSYTVYTFENTAFINKPLDLDYTDSLNVKKKADVFLSHTQTYLMADSTPWYTEVIMEGSIDISYLDFYKNEKRRYFPNRISTQNPAFVFRNGIQVGMSRDEFIQAFKITNELAKKATSIRVTDDKLSDAEFRFVGDKLNSISIEYAYYPEDMITLEDVCVGWQAISEPEKEGDQMTRDCEGYSYSFSTEPIVFEDSETKYVDLLNIGMVQDSQSDTIRAIRRTGEGFLIIAVNKYNENKDYVIEVIFKDKERNVATWNGDLFGKSEWAASNLPVGECPDYGENGEL